MFALSSSCSLRTPETAVAQQYAINADSSSGRKSSSFNPFHDRVSCRGLLNGPAKLFSGDIESMDCLASISSVFGETQNGFTAAAPGGTHRRCSSSWEETNAGDGSKILNRKGSIFSSSFSVQLDATLPYHSSKADICAMESIGQNDGDPTPSWFLSSSSSEKMSSKQLMQQSSQTTERSVFFDNQVSKIELTHLLETQERNISPSMTAAQRFHCGSFDTKPCHPSKKKKELFFEKRDLTSLACSRPLRSSHLTIEDSKLLELIASDLIVDEERLKRSRASCSEENGRGEPTPLGSSIHGSQTLAGNSVVQSSLHLEANILGKTGNSPLGGSPHRCTKSEEGRSNEKKMHLQALNEEENQNFTISNHSGFLCTSNRSTSEVKNTLDGDREDSGGLKTLFSSPEKEAKDNENDSLIYHESKLESISRAKERKAAKECPCCPISSPLLSSPVASTSPTSSTSSSFSSFPLPSERSKGEKCFTFSEIAPRLPFSQEEREEMEKCQGIADSKGYFPRRTESSTTYSSTDRGARLGSVSAESNAPFHSTPQHTKVLHNIFFHPSVRIHLRKWCPSTSQVSAAAPGGLKEKLFKGPCGRHEIEKPCGPPRPSKDLADVLHECKFLGMKDIIASVSDSSALGLLNEFGHGVNDLESNSESNRRVKVITSLQKTIQNVSNNALEGPENACNSSSIFPSCSPSNRCNPLSALSGSSSSVVDMVKTSTSSWETKIKSPNSSSRLTPNQALYLAAAMTEKELHESSEQGRGRSGKSSEWEKMHFVEVGTGSGAAHHVDFSQTHATRSTLSSPISNYGEETLPFPYISDLNSDRGTTPMSPRLEILDPLEHKFISDSPRSIAFRHYSPHDSSSICASSTRSGKRGTGDNVERCTSPRGLGQSAESYSKPLASSRSIASILQGSLRGSEGKGLERVSTRDGLLLPTRSSVKQNNQVLQGKVVYVLTREGENSLLCCSFHDELFRVRDLIRYAARVEEVDSWDSLKRSETELIT